MNDQRLPESPPRRTEPAGEAAVRLSLDRTAGPKPAPHQIFAHPLVHGLFLAFLVSLIYSNSYRVPFVFDDIRNITANPLLKDFSAFTDLDKAKQDRFYRDFQLRFAGFLSFAANVAAGGLDPFGFHLVNVLIHILNTLLVYSLVMLAFSAPKMNPEGTDPGDPGGETKAFVAFFTAFFFACHPLQTQAVTYIVQRFASLVTTFYLVATVLYISGRIRQERSESCFPSLFGAFVSVVIAMKTKENAFTIPLALAAVELTFFNASWKRRLAVLAPFALTLGILPYAYLGSQPGDFDAQTKILTSMSRSDYLFTQFAVVGTYIRMLFFPAGQNFDHDFPILSAVTDPRAFFPFVGHLCFILTAAWTVLKSPTAGDSADPEKARLWRFAAFGILWFYVTISAESSLIPIVDVIYEHRVYLPSPGAWITVFSLVALLPFFAGSQRRNLVILLIGVGMVFSILTFRRNFVWWSETSLWEDVVAKSPRKMRGYANLGACYLEANRFADAEAVLNRGLSLAPGNDLILSNLGTMAYKKFLIARAAGDSKLARSQLEEALNRYRLSLAAKKENNPAQVWLENGIRELEALDSPPMPSVASATGGGG